MIDVNYPLRKAYVSALAPLGYGVYNAEAPDDIDDAVYIVISDLTSGDNKTKNSKQTDTGIRITIHTWQTKYNPGKVVDEVAALVYQAVYPESKSTIEADGLQIITTTFDSDTMDYGTLGERKYISRIIRFRHKIFIQ